MSDNIQLCSVSFTPQRQQRSSGQEILLKDDPCCWTSSASVDILHSTSPSQALTQLPTWCSSTRTVLVNLLDVWTLIWPLSCLPGHTFIISSAVCSLFTFWPIWVSIYIAIIETPAIHVIGLWISGFWPHGGIVWISTRKYLTADNNGVLWPSDIRTHHQGNIVLCIYSFRHFSLKACGDFWNIMTNRFASWMQSVLIILTQIKKKNRVIMACIGSDWTGVISSFLNFHHHLHTLKRL